MIGFRLNRLALPLALAALLGLAACNKTQTSERPPEPGDVAVARVDGQTIWASDVRNEAASEGQIGPGEPLDMTSGLFERSLNDLIDQRLLAKAARDHGIDKSLTVQRQLAAMQDRFLGDQFINNNINAKIDDNAVKAQYDDQVKLSKQSEEIRTRLILLKTKDDADAAMKALQGGALFEAMAMERSIDKATRFSGGDMGYISTDIMPQAYATVLATAKAGDTVGPVQTDGGWAVLRVEDRRPEQMPTLDEERPVIMRYLVYNQVAGLLKNLRDSAQVDMLIPKSAFKDDEQEPASAPQTADGTDAADAVSDDEDDSAAAASLPAKLKAAPAPKPPELLPAADPTAGHHFFAPASAGKGH